MKYYVFLLSMLFISTTQADDFKNHYGTYKVTHGDNKIGLAFIYPTYKFQKKDKKAKIMIRKSPYQAFWGVVEHDDNNSLVIEYKGEFDLVMKSHCNDANLKLGNENFTCDGVMFDSVSSYTLEKLNGKEETKLLTSWFDKIPADNYVGTFSVPPSSSDMGQKGSKVTFSKSAVNFLDVKIENDLSSFDGYAKPMGNKFLYIYYKDEVGNKYGVDCMVASENYNPVGMHCTGTLQGVNMKSEHNSFRLTR